MFTSTQSPASEPNFEGFGIGPAFIGKKELGRALVHLNIESLDELDVDKLQLKLRGEEIGLQSILAYPFCIVIDEESLAQPRCSIRYNYHDEANKCHAITIDLDANDSRVCLKIIIDKLKLIIAENNEDNNNEEPEDMNRVLAHLLDSRWGFHMQYRSPSYSSDAKDLVALAKKHQPQELGNLTKQLRDLDRVLFTLDENLTPEPAQADVVKTLTTESKKQTTLLLLGQRPLISSDNFTLEPDPYPNHEGLDTAQYYLGKALDEDAQLMVADYSTVRQLSSDGPPFNANVTKLVIRCHGGPSEPLPSCEDMMALLNKFPHVERVVLRTCTGVNPDEAKTLLHEAKAIPGALHRFKGEKAPTAYLVPPSYLTEDKKKRLKMSESKMQEFLRDHPGLSPGDTLVSVTKKEDNFAAIQYCQVMATKSGDLRIGPIGNNNQQISNENKLQFLAMLQPPANKNESEPKTLNPLSPAQSQTVLPPELQAQPEAPKHKFKKSITNSTRYLRMWKSEEKKDETGNSALSTRLGALAQELNGQLVEKGRTLTLKAYVGPYDYSKKNGFVQTRESESEYKNLPKAIEVEVGIPRAASDTAGPVVIHAPAHKS